MNDKDELYEERMKQTELETELDAVETREEDLEFQQPMVTRSAHHTEESRTTEESNQLSWLKDDEIEQLQSRWNSIQTRFVDDPHSSVRQADELVSESLQRIQRFFTDQRSDLESRWNNKEDVSTEDLRVDLQSYRSFFNRLLKF